jgi:D-alanyl-D-alanine carboxypeptidase
LLLRNTGNQLPVPPRPTDDITILQLLQHDAGVFDVDNETGVEWGGKSYVHQQLDRDPLHQFTADELVGELTRLNLKYFEPGVGNKYSNTGYTILSEIVARVYSARSGAEKKYSDYLYDHIIGGSSPVPLDTIRFPHLATDDTLPDPWVRGIEYAPGVSTPTFFTARNMSAHVAEGNGYGNFVDLNTFVRTLFSGRNVLDSQSVDIMVSTVSPHTSSYALGCDHVRNLGYGHNGAIYGYLSTIRYNPDTDVSIVVLMPLIDGSNLTACILEGLYKAAWETLRVLGYPGQP